MKHFIKSLFAIMALLLTTTSAWAEDDEITFNITYLLNGVDKTNATDKPGTVVSVIDGTTATLTITPKEGNFFEYTKENIKVYKTIDGINAQARKRSQVGPDFNAPIKLSVSSSSLTGDTKLTFEGKKEYDYDVVVNFKTRTSIKNNNTAITLEKDKYSYMGEEIKPNVKEVKLADGTKLETTDYTITYSNNTNVPKENDPKPTVTIKGIGKYLGEASTNFTIDPATLTVQADNKEIAYGDAPPTYSVSYSGFKNGETKDVLTGTLTFTCSYKQGDNAGTYPITPGGLTEGNYTFNYVSGTLTVDMLTGSITFAETAYEKTFGDAPFKNTLTYEGDGTVSYSSSNSKIASVNASTGEVTVLRAGTATITATLNNINYTDTKASFEVTVYEQAVSGTNGTSITLDADGYHIDMDETVGPGMVIPDNITYAEIIYARLLDISGKTPVDIDGEASYLFTVCEPFDPKFNAKFYTLTGVSNGSLQFDEIEGKAQARTPYLVSTTHNVALKDAYALDVVIEGHKLTEEEKDAVLYTYESGVNFSGDVINPDPVDGYQLKGTLRGLTNADAAAEGALILQSDGRWGAVKAGNEDVYIPPFRAYVVGTTQNARTFDSSFGDGATGIERIVTVDRDGTERWYDLQGRPIERPATKGIYIHNGRKEAVK